MKTQFNKWLVACFMLLAAFAPYAEAQVRGEVSDEFLGEGTEDDPYLISTAADLRKLADDVEKGMTYREEFLQLTNDIVVNEGVLDEEGNLNEDYSEGFEEWKPIGTEKTHFCGTLDGAHYSIYGLYINHEDETPKGLFAYLSGTVKNLAIRDAYFCSNSTMGSIAGIAETITINKKDYIPNISYCLNYATMEAFVYSSNKNDVNCGGICGYMTDCSLSKCANWGHISCFRDDSANKYARLGGIIGGYELPYEGGCPYDVFDCCNFGVVKARSGGCGGIIGLFYDYDAVGRRGGQRAHFNNCANHATIHSSSMIGGIGGRIFWGNVDGCVNYGNIECEKEEAEFYGAIFGDYCSASFIRNCAYLETTCDVFAPSLNNTYTGSDAGNNKVMTKKEMKQQSFLDELNANAKKLGKNYSKWKFGSDGFPTLAWVDEELANGISDILFTDKAARTVSTKNIHNMNGQLVRSNSVDTDGLPQGIYIVGGKKVIVTK